MGNLLSSLPKTIHASLALAIIFFLGLFYGNGGFDFDTIFWSWLTRLIHVTVAIMWIGLLWYFNFLVPDLLVIYANSVFSSISSPLRFLSATPR